MSHVDLCSGIGGFALGFEWAGLSKPVLFCDIEPWSRKVLAKHWPDVPIADDVKELASDPDRFIPRTDPRNTILSSGYPCQPFSVAGKQRGTEDDRHIWPFISQIIAHKRPAFCVLENVYGHVALGLDEVLADLEAQDYATRAFIVPACAVNAPHRRDRLWIIGRNVGNPEHDGSSAATVSGKHREDDARGAEGQSASEQSEGASEPRHDANVGNAAHNGWNGGAAQAERERATHQSNQSRSKLWGKSIGSGENVADTDSERGRLWHTEWQDAENVRRWNTEPRICHLVDGLPKGLDRFDGWEREPADIPRVATGVKDRVSRLKGLGNAIVPSIAMQIGLTIKAVRDA
jgi:DNA (cytosine-5)-methyltransferase 1